MEQAYVWIGLLVSLLLDKYDIEQAVHVLSTSFSPHLKQGCLPLRMTKSIQWEKAQNLVMLFVNIRRKGLRISL